MCVCVPCASPSLECVGVYVCLCACVCQDGLEEARRAVAALQQRAGECDNRLRVNLIPMRAQINRRMAAPAADPTGTLTPCACVCEWCVLVCVMCVCVPCGSDGAGGGAAAAGAAGSRQS